MPIIVRSRRTENRFYIDNEFLNGYAKRVGWQGQCVYPALCRHERSGKAFPSIKHLAEELGISDSSVRRGVSNLKAHNIVQVERLGKTLNNVYWLIDYKMWSKIPKSEWSNRTITSRVSVPTEKVSVLTERSECSHRTHNNTNRIILNKNNTNILSAKADEEPIRLTNTYIAKEKQKHVRVILAYASMKGKEVFDNAKQLSSFISRNCRPAKSLDGYSKQRILETMKWLKSNADFKWTLESVGKYIDEDLDKLTSDKIKTLEL